MANVIPTKGNLLSRERALALAGLGFELMDRKRNILIREMMNRIESASVLQEQIDTTFREAYASLQNANITLGSCGEIAGNVPVDESVQIRHRSVMGVELPIIRASEEPPGLHYGLAFTNAALDDALLRFDAVKRLTRELAEMESTIYRLAYAAKKAQKRANALQNIIIPGFIRDIKYITDALEEKDREEYARLKVIKETKRA